jgi:hypothetical protein
MKLWSLGLLGLSFFLFPNYQLSKQSFVCPQELEPLIEQMLKDLPSYANRVIQRSRFQQSEVDPTIYVLLAGKPNYTPLPLPIGQNQTGLPDRTEQVFFTTLERRYIYQGVQERQNYHWLFLTSVDGHRKLVMLYTQLGSITPGTSPSPPLETSRGIVGQAVTLWLRDCQAGTIRIY